MTIPQKTAPNGAVVLNFRKSHTALKEAFTSLGCTVVENGWDAPANCVAAVVELYEAIRQPIATLQLKQQVNRLGRPLVGLKSAVAEAIGADKKQFERSAVAQRFREWVEDYGLGFSVKRKSKIVVPAYAGTLQLSSARPTDPAPAAPPPSPGGR